MNQKIAKPDYLVQSSDFQINVFSFVSIFYLHFESSTTDQAKYPSSSPRNCQCLRFKRDYLRFYTLATGEDLIFWSLPSLQKYFMFDRLDSYLFLG